MVWRDWKRWLNFVFFGDGWVQDEKERDERWLGILSWETVTWEKFVCKSIYNPRWCRYESRSGLELHPYEVFSTQSAKSYPWFPIFARILHIVLIIIPIFLFHIHNSTIIAVHKVKSSLSISPCHDHEFTPSTAYTEYKHTPSTAYIEYSIHPMLFVFTSFSWLRVDPWM